MKISIEPALSTDLPEILTLQKIAYQREAARYGDWSIPPLVQTLRQMESEFGSMVILKASEGGCIVGSVRAALEDGTCRIGRLIVSLGHQRKGIGTLLMESIEAAFDDAVRFELFTGVNSSDNIHFYQKRGYRMFEERELSSAIRLVFMEKSK